MSWSWSNPSWSEAEEAYAYYRNKYEESARRKRTSERQEQAYYAERSAARAEKTSLSSQKINFEERLAGIVRIIGMLEGTGGWHSVNVPSALSQAQKTLSRTQETFQTSIRLSGGGGAANLEQVFSVKTVEADPSSASALQAFRTEKLRLEREIEELRHRIDSLSEEISSLSQRISSCNETQWSLQHQMNSYAFDMNHFRNKMY